MSQKPMKGLVLCRNGNIYLAFQESSNPDTYTRPGGQPVENVKQFYPFTKNR